MGLPNMLKIHKLSPEVTEEKTALENYNSEAPNKEIKDIGSASRTK